MLLVRKIEQTLQRWMALRVHSAHVWSPDGHSLAAIAADGTKIRFYDFYSRKWVDLATVNTNFSYAAAQRFAATQPLWACLTVRPCTRFQCLVK